MIKYIASNENVTPPPSGVTQRCPGTGIFQLRGPGAPIKLLGAPESY